jgi:hypothetical protein
MAEIIQGTFGAQSGNIWSHSGNIWLRLGNFWSPCETKHVEAVEGDGLAHTQGTIGPRFREHLVPTQGTFGFVQGTFGYLVRGNTSKP